MKEYKHIEQYQTGNYHIAECRFLNTAGVGFSPEEALDSLRTQLDIFFEETNERGTLVELLQKYAWEELVK